MIVRIVRFRSNMSAEEVQATYERRSDRYRQVPGLVQKYYLCFAETGEHGAVYVWDSEASLRAFSESELARTLPDAYQVKGNAMGETAEVVMTLFEERNSRVLTDS